MAFVSHTIALTPTAARPQKSPSQPLRTPSGLGCQESATVPRMAGVSGERADTTVICKKPNFVPRLSLKSYSSSGMKRWLEKTTFSFCQDRGFLNTLKKIRSSLEMSCSDTCKWRRFLLLYKGSVLPTSWSSRHFGKKQCVLPLYSFKLQVFIVKKNRYRRTSEPSQPFLLLIWTSTKNVSCTGNLVWDYFFFFFEHANGSSWARDQTQAIAATWAAAMTRHILNLLCQKGTPIFFFLLLNSKVKVKFISTDSYFIDRN